MTIVKKTQRIIKALCFVLVLGTTAVTLASLTEKAEPVSTITVPAVASTVADKGITSVYPPAVLFAAPKLEKQVALYVLSMKPKAGVKAGNEGKGKSAERAVDTKRPTALFWLKYKCDVPNQVEDRMPNRIAENDIEELCPEIEGTRCAELYDESELELDPAYPPSSQIYRVKITVGQPVPTPDQTVYCPVN